MRVRANQIFGFVWSHGIVFPQTADWSWWQPLLTFHTVPGQLLVPLVDAVPSAQDYSLSTFPTFWPWVMMLEIFISLQCQKKEPAGEHPLLGFQPAPPRPAWWEPWSCPVHFAFQTNNSLLCALPNWSLMPLLPTQQSLNNQGGGWSGKCRGGGGWVGGQGGLSALISSE